MHQLFRLLSTPLCHLTTWHVELGKARIWRHHCPELVEFVNHGMLIEEGPYPVHRMFKHTEIGDIEYIGYGNSHQHDAIHILEDAFRNSNFSIIQLFS